MKGTQIARDHRTLRVLTYHRVASERDSPDLDPLLVSATPEVFRRQMLYLRKRYNAVTLSQVMEAFIEGRPLPERAVLVTFDDAYRDFIGTAWPIMREIGIPVTVFVPTAYPDDPTRVLWWDRLHRATAKSGGGEVRKRAARAAAEALATMVSTTNDDLRDVRATLRALPFDVTERVLVNAFREAGVDIAETSSSLPAVLSWNEIRGLAEEGVTFGAHTRHHAALTSLDEATVRSEIRGSLDDLTRELGPGARAIAYPYGIYNAAVVRIAEEEGCALGFTTEDGINEVGRSGLFQLGRMNVTKRTSPRIFALRMAPWFVGIDRMRHWRERRRRIA